MPTPLIRTSPELVFDAGDLVAVAVPVTPAGSLAKFSGFELYIWADPKYPRQGADAGEVPDPVALGWQLAATLTGTAAGDTVTFVGTLPTGAGVRRYVLAASGLGGTGGPAGLVRATWLTLLPSRPLA